MLHKATAAATVNIKKYNTVTSSHIIDKGSSSGRGTFSLPNSTLKA
jgi:hypothetical protein